jgi:hypothetical protein
MMNKNERLLRASALILIVRDEWEEQELHPEWCEAADTYIDGLAIDEIIKQQYENYFSFVDGLVRTVAEPGEVANELFVILRKDLNQVKVTNKIIHATNVVKLEGYDVGKVKLIDSVTNNFIEK